jgi:hypothetical protein
MLQSTATADAKVRAPRHDTSRRRLEDLQQLGFVMLPVMASTAEADALTREGTGHESRLPLPDYSLRIVRESRNGCDFFDAAHDPAGSAAQTAPHACRNSAKCGSLPARNNAFTRSSSSVYRSRVKRPRMSSKRR